MLRPHKSEPAFGYQMIMNTKSTVQGIGYNVRGFLNDLYEDSIEVNSHSSAWLLGRCHTTTDAFYAHWNALLRMTYRRDWADPILNPKSQVVYDSDTGWGCTIRSAQMLLANIIGPNKESLFLDREAAPFSVHAFVHCGGKFVGDWLGPTSVAISLATLIRRSHLPLGVVTSLDGRIYVPSLLAASSQEVCEPIILAEDEMEWSGRSPSWEMCQSRAHDEINEDEYCTSPFRSRLSVAESSVSSNDSAPARQPVLVLCPLRLSPDSVLSDSILAALLAYMTLPSFAGLLGGPEKRCLYIPGVLQGSTLLCVDPHIVQEAVVCKGADEFRNATHPTRLSASQLGPSLCIAFLIRDNSQISELETQISEIKRKCDGAFLEIRKENISTAFPTNRAQSRVVEDGEEIIVL